MQHNDLSGQPSEAARATRIAAHLALIAGETWSVQPHRYRDELHVLRAERDGAALILEPTRERGRLAMSGSFWIDAINVDDHRLDCDRQHRITVAGSRPAPEIATAIARRLLPDYRAALAAARERKAGYDASRAEEEQTARMLAAIVGGELISHRHDQFVRYSAGAGGVHLDGYVTHGAGVTLEIDHLTPDQAVRILEIVKE